MKHGLRMVLREGAKARVDEVVMDEFHYYSDAARGFAWQTARYAA